MGKKEEMRLVLRHLHKSLRGWRERETSEVKMTEWKEEEKEDGKAERDETCVREEVCGGGKREYEWMKKRNKVANYVEEKIYRLEEEETEEEDGNL